MRKPALASTIAVAFVANTAAYVDWPIPYAVSSTKDDPPMYVKNPAVARHCTTTCRRKGQWRARSAIRCSVRPSPAGCRRSGASVSGSATTTATTMTRPKAARSPKTDRQLPTARTTPPTAGATTGPRKTMDARVP